MRYYLDIAIGSDSAPPTRSAAKSLSPARHERDRCAAQT